jgi:lipopolysaccharide export system permease protein
MAAMMLFKIGAVLVVITFIVGELITPRTSPLAEKVKLSAKGQAVSQAFRSGMWTKDVVRSQGATGDVIGSRFFNARQVRPDGTILGVKIYEFDSSFRMHSLITADSASFDGGNTWHLVGATETLFSNTLPVADQGGVNFGQEGNVVSTRKVDSMSLVSGITPKIVSVSAADPDRMSANELAVYTRHLAENRQETDRFKIAFWKKLFDPLAIFVLMALALPFAYLHTRSGGVSLKILIGIMIGMSFILFNTLFSHLGMLTTWPAYMTAIAPSLLFLMLALGALWWVERH